MIRLAPAGSPLGASGRRALLAAAVLAVALLASACSPDGPRPIAYEQEACGYCRMTISDRRFGAQARTAGGRVNAFDSVECLAAYVHGTDAAQLRGVWVTDYNRPGTFVAADSATFWQVGGGISPMGKGLVATAGGTPPAGVAEAGEPMRWAAVVALVAAEGMRAAAGADHAH